MPNWVESLVPASVADASAEGRRRAHLIVYATLFCVLVPLPVAVILAAMSGVMGGEIVMLGLVALPQMLRLDGSRR